MLEFIFEAFLIACISWVYHCVLREKLLSKWFLFGFKKFNHRVDWTYFFYEPIFNCEKCLSGQLALWSFPFLFKYNFFLHLGFIAVSIFIISLITHILKND